MSPSAGKFPNSAPQSSLVQFLAAALLLITLPGLSSQAATSVIVGWGYNIYNDTHAPTNLTNAVSIDAGYSHSLALKPDGTAQLWGFSDIGGPPLVVPQDLTNAVAIAAGCDHDIALRADGTLVYWGGFADAPSGMPPGLSNVVAIAAGCDHDVVLKADGTIIAWGDVTNTPPPLTNVVWLEAGQCYTLALQADGTVVAWGVQGAPELNVPPALTNVVAISGGPYHCVALRRDGTVIAWGSNDMGQTNVPPGLTNIVAISAGRGHTLALSRDGILVYWGTNRYYFVSNTIPGGLTNILSFAAHRHSLALLSELSWSPFAQPLNVTYTNGTFTASVQTIRGHWYRLEYQDALGSSRWTLGPPIVGDGSQKTLSAPADSLQRFFLIRQK
jgi:alpha-tubulin suppressor-like RCC1 family protein